MTKAKVNGIGLFYKEQGKGYPLVFLHGFAGTAEMWNPQFSAFSAKYRFIAWDARGHYRSDSPPTKESYSADIIVEDLYQLFQHLKLERAVLGGLSMGGYISLRFYLRHPQKVSALILMDTGPGYRNPQRREEWNRQQEERAVLLETKGIAAFANDPSTSEMDYYTPRELMLKMNPVGLAHMDRKVVGQHDALVIEHLKEIKVPTLCLVGEKDTPFLTAIDYMAKEIPGARKVVIPNAGHSPNLDDPPLFNKTILDFLNGLKLK